MSKITFSNIYTLTDEERLGLIWCLLYSLPDHEFKNNCGNISIQLLRVITKTVGIDKIREFWHEFVNEN